MRMRVAVLLVIAVAAVAGGAIACGGQPAAPSSTLPGTTTSASETGTTTAPAQSTTTVVDPLSDRIAYALSLGGQPHEGETLFFVVGATVDTEEQAQTLLKDALPYFGDMQSYFIVQKSDNFEGMEPGKWVVIEAYMENPSAENVEFGKRGFPTVYVVKAKVKTADPIPVYEDRLGL